jgi:hypothetical protein
MRSVPEYAAEAEEADDAYSLLVAEAAEARADYEEARETSKLMSKQTSVSGRNEEADAAAIKERRLFLIAEAREKAARTHVQVVLGLLVAAQSHQKHAGKQDGGTNWGDF